MLTGGQLIGFAFLLIAAAGASGQKVAVEYEARGDYSGFLTYAWARGIQVKDRRIDRAIIEGIDWRLGAAGLQRVDGSGDPDLVCRLLLEKKKNEGREPERSNQIVRHALWQREYRRFIHDTVGRHIAVAGLHPGIAGEPDTLARQ